jgi:hypothetical protein
MLNTVVARIMNQAGQGGDYQADTDEFEEIDFGRVYEIGRPGPQRFEVFLKKQRFEVRENETWLQIAERLAARFDMTQRGICGHDWENKSS